MAKFWISALALSLAMTCASAVGLGITFASIETPTVRAAVAVPADQQQVIDQAVRSCPTLTPARLAGQLMAESGFDPGASSSSGGHGVAGLTDAAWSRWRPQAAAARDDVKANIVALAHDMCDLIGQVRAADVPGDGWRDALAAYRSGIAAVVKAGGVPADATGYVDLVAAYAGFYALPQASATASATPSEPQSQARQSAAPVPPPPATAQPTTGPTTSPRPSPPPAPPAPPASPIWTTLTVMPTTVLERGQSVHTNRTELVMATNGDLEIFDEGHRMRWTSGTSGRGGYRAAFQDDGNLVVYDQYGQGLWASGTAGNNGAVLVLEADGNVCVVYQGIVIWAANTAH